jgi:hypothetical protein
MVKARLALLGLHPLHFIRYLINITLALLSALRICIFPSRVFAGIKGWEISTPRTHECLMSEDRMVPYPNTKIQNQGTKTTKDERPLDNCEIFITVFIATVVLLGFQLICIRVANPDLLAELVLSQFWMNSAFSLTLEWIRWTVVWLLEVDMCVACCPHILGCAINYHSAVTDSTTL